MNPSRYSKHLFPSVSKPNVFTGRSGLPHYGAVIASIGLTAFIGLLLDGSLADKNRFIIYLPAVLFSAWYGGFVPGVLAFLLGGIAGVIVYGLPVFNFNWSDSSNSLGLLLYFMAGGCMVFWVRAQENAHSQAAVKHHDLEREVLERTRIADQQSQLLIHEQHARAEADKSNAMKSQFVGMVAHELRTPLTLIKGFTSSMLAEDVIWEADDQHKFLQIIDEEADRLNELIDQLLDVTQMQAGKLRIHPLLYSFAEIISHTGSELEILAQNHQLILAISQDLPLIMADPQRLAQVLLNLVGNATKYSPPHTTITITAQQHASGIQVDVADEGAGIPLSQRTKVFEAYRQLDDGAVRSTKGSGLGLAICKGLVEAHGGTIWIGEQVAPGTLVSFMLPLSDSSPDPPVGKQKGCG
jgi:signal transduction histidine kinase